MADSDEIKVKSTFHLYREQHQPRVPQVLLAQELNIKTQPVQVLPEIKNLFPALTKTDPLAVTFEEAPQQEKIITPLRIGCVLSGGQAAGGHNVIVGIYEYIKRRNPNSQLIGFLGGPKGVIEGKIVELKQEAISFYKNRGGFDMIKSGRDKIEKPEEFEKSMKVCQSLKLDGLVVIGGDDSNTNACLLADYFVKNNCPTKVIGCPKTIDGDLKNDYVEVSFGYDTACKTYGELIGNLMMDTLSTKKYYHFIRLMGRSASHIALECALLTRPNYCYIGEEVEQKKVKLSELVQELVDVIVERYKRGKDYGVILVPEGIVEFVVEMKNLIKEINEIFSKQMKDFKGEVDVVFAEVCKYLTAECKALLEYLPRNIANQLLLDRDPHGNVQVAKIESERLLISLCKNELKKRQEYKGKFSTQTHYFGYEGRCAFPSDFDCDYCYNLGVNAGILIEKQFTGVMSVIRNLGEDQSKWVPGGYPLVTMMIVERRKGKDVPVIKKALTDLNGDLFKLYKQELKTWSVEDCYRSIGPLQYEFRCLPPFLVKSPNFENMYNSHSKKYIPEKTPYYPINPKYNMSELNLERLYYKTELPKILNSDYRVVKQHSLQFQTGEVKFACEKNFPYVCKESTQLVEVLNTTSISDEHIEMPRRQQVRIGVVYNGRQAPGGNNVIEGLLRFTEQNKGKLYGFIEGTKGLFECKAIEIDRDTFEFYNNTGGFTFLGRSADKLRTPKELDATKAACDKLGLDGLVLVGATHTCTDALILTNYLLEKGSPTRVIVVPATIDGNIGHHMLEAVVGFDTAAKVYSQLIGNIMIDSASAIKYFYFIRLMGRDPSHLVLECALQTHPNITLISEEVASKGWNLADVVNYISDIVSLRASKKKNYGTCLVPEGLLSFLPEFKQLIDELNNLFKPLDEKQSLEVATKLLKDPAFVDKSLSGWTAARFKSLPDFTQEQLVFEREVHGSIQLSQIETERLLAHLVEKELKKRKGQGQFNGSFSSVTHYFGYQGRSATPSIFDCDLGAVYGYLAGTLVEAKVTGYCTTARGLMGDTKDWHVGAIPLINMAVVKTKSQYGEKQPVVPSFEVNLYQKPFQQFKKDKNVWKLTDYYANPGPTQFFGIRAKDRILSLKLTHENYLSRIKQIKELSLKINSECRFGTHEDLLNITIQHLQNLEDTLQLIKHKYI